MHAKTRVNADFLFQSSEHALQFLFFVVKCKFCRTEFKQPATFAWHSCCHSFVSHLGCSDIICCHQIQKVCCTSVFCIESLLVTSSSSYSVSLSHAVEDNVPSKLCTGARARAHRS